MPALQTWVLICDGCGATFHPPASGLRHRPSVTEWVVAKTCSLTMTVAEGEGWSRTFHEPPGGQGLGWYTYACSTCSRSASGTLVAR